MMKKLLVSVSLTFIYATSAYAAGGAGKASPHHGHGTDGHHEASSGLPQLDPTYFTSQAFWLIVIFIFMYVVFALKSIPAISQTVENRSERIKSDLSSAEQVKKEPETPAHVVIRMYCLSVAYLFRRSPCLESFG